MRINLLKKSAKWPMQIFLCGLLWGAFPVTEMGAQSGNWGLDNTPIAHVFDNPVWNNTNDRIRNKEVQKKIDEIRRRRYEKKNPKPKEAGYVNDLPESLQDILSAPLGENLTSAGLFSEPEVQILRNHLFKEAEKLVDTYASYFQGGGVNSREFLDRVSRNYRVRMGAEGPDIGFHVSNEVNNLIVVSFGFNFVALGVMTPAQLKQLRAYLGMEIWRLVNLDIVFRFPEKVPDSTVEVGLNTTQPDSAIRKQGGDETGGKPIPENLLPYLFMGAMADTLVDMGVVSYSELQVLRAQIAIESGKLYQAEKLLKAASTLSGPASHFHDARIHLYSEITKANLLSITGRENKVDSMLLNLDNLTQNLSDKAFESQFLRDLAKLWANNGGTDYAFSLLEHAMLIDSISAEKTDRQAVLDLMLAGKFFQLADEQEAGMESFGQALDNCMKLPPGIREDLLPEIELLLSSAYLAVHKDSMAEIYLRSALVSDSLRPVLSKLERIQALTRLARLCLLRNAEGEAYFYLSHSIQSLKSFFLENIRMLSSEEQLAFFYDLDDEMDEVLALIKPGSGKMVELMYEFAVFRKGIALELEILRRTIGWQSGTSELKKFMDKLAAPNNDAADWKKNASKNRPFLRTNLMAHFENPWNQIEEALSENSVAIEFVRLPLTDKSGYRYAGIIIRKDLPVSMKYLALESELIGCNSGNGSGTVAIRGVIQGNNDTTHKANIANELHNLIWAPMDSLLAGIDTVYYSPAGRLNLIPFEMMEDSLGIPLLDQTRLCRLVSTHHLTLRNIDFDRGSRVHLFGGLRYSPVRPDSASGKGFTRTWNSLRGSMDEVLRISRIVSANGGQSISYMDSLGTEQTFLDLQKDRSIGIVHLATHGFNLEDSIKANGPELVSDFRNPMLRSGLIMAYPFPYAIDESSRIAPTDGWLNAYEVACLNLSHMRLAVLSACETAKGDIIGSEGVFGLGRAFLMAGVDHVMMSLWPVPDAETAEFMAQFYHYLYLHGDFQVAFWEAQSLLREMYPDRPEIWAAFVLI